MSKPSYLCSCIICKEEKSYKGIHSHYLIAHTEGGNRRAVTNGKIGAAGAVARTRQQLLNRQLLYNQDPAHCKTCTTILPYELRHNKFCNHSCSATHTNKTRKPYSKAQMKRMNDSRSKKLTGKKKNLDYTSRRMNYCPVRSSVCSYCAALFIQLSYMKRKSCSDACHTETLRRNARIMAAKIPRRSKQEKELYELCVNLTPNITHNTSVVDGWDADIVFNDQKIAVLWNGPWHYREMNMNNHSLKQVQTRDNHKKKLFENNGWTVLIFEDRNYSPETAFNIIKEYIDGRCHEI